MNTYQVMAEKSSARTYAGTEEPLLLPVNEKERIVCLDVVRGFAALGILLINIELFSMARADVLNPATGQYSQGLNYWIWFACHILAEQKFMAIFSLLFGAGILLMTSRAEAAGRPSALLHYRRMGFLTLLGLAHAYLLWSGDILVAYGLCGSLAYLVRKLRPSTLLALAFVLLLVGSTLWGMFAVLSPTGIAQALNWTSLALSSPQEVAAYRGGWLTQMTPRVQEAVQSETVEFVFFTFWRISGLMLAGMAFFKLGILQGRSSRRAYWQMIGIALCVGLPVALYGVYFNLVPSRTSIYATLFGMQFDYWSSLLLGAGWVGALILASTQVALTSCSRRIAAVGRMALTNYLVQTLLCTTIFYGHGLGLFGKVDRAGQLGIVVAVWLFQLTVSPIWLKHFLYGPMEWLWRCVTYMRLEPLSRTATS